METQEKIDFLIDFIRYDYPRAASLLKWHWGTPQAEGIFNELMVYEAESNREGFTTEVFSAINELHDIHRSLMDN